MNKLGKVAVALAMAFSVGAANAAVPADYVQQGLLAQWDGLQNVDETSWTDLVSGRAFQLTGVSAGEDGGLVFAGSASSYGILGEADTQAVFAQAAMHGTVEIVMKSDNASGNEVVLQSTKASNVVIGRNGTSTIMACTSDYLWTWTWGQDLVTVAVTYRNNVWQTASADGERKPKSTSRNSYDPSGSSTTIGVRGSRANNHFKGSIYAIRVYSRPLTQPEIMLNQALDKARFAQGDVAPALFVQVEASKTDSGDFVDEGTDRGFRPFLGAKSVAVPDTEGKVTFTAPDKTFDNSPARTATVTGGTLYEIVNGEEIAVATTETCTLTYAPGANPLKMAWNVVYADGILGAKEFHADPVNGDDEYEGDDIGSAAHPFRTLDAAHAAAAAHIASAEGAKALVWLAEGRFDQTNPIEIIAGEAWKGKGAGKTFINAKPCSTISATTDAFLRLVGEDSLLSSLCVTGFVGDTSASKMVSKQLWLKKGLVDHVRSAYHQTKNNDGIGGGLYMEGGKAQYCEFDNNILPAMYTQGAGVWMSGGELLCSSVHDNTGNDARSCCGGGVYIKGGTVSRCHVYHNGWGVNFTDGDAGGGVYLLGGTLENSLITDNRVLGAANSGGVQNAGGTVINCTICGNTSQKDTTCVSGLIQSSGTGYNNLIFGNYKAGASVTGGTFVNNLLDAEVAGFADNFVTDDPKFVDAANGDFHIDSRFSPAVGKALPFAEVDYDGVERDRLKPTIGAFEFVAGEEDFAVALLITKRSWRTGDAPTVELIVSGAPDKTKLSVAWYLDGVEKPALAGSLMPSFAESALGWHAVKAVATYEDQVKESEDAAAFAVLPLKTYVNATGNGTFPYATPETGTNSLNAAYEAVWKSNDETTTIDLAEGVWTLSDVISLAYSVSIEGKGADKTAICGYADAPGRLVTLKDPGAALRNLALTNSVGFGGLKLEQGLVDHCRIVRCNSSEYSGRGAGVHMTGGTLQNSEILDCEMADLSVRGGGIALTGDSAVVSNCTISGCTCHCGTRSPEGQMGGGVYAEAGLLTNCRIVGNGDRSKGNVGIGGGIYSVKPSTGGTNLRVRNCLIAGNSTLYTNAVVLLHGVIHNVTVADNSAPSGVVEVVAGENATLANSILWGKAINPTVTCKTAPDHCCWPTAEEGVNGNTAKDPRFRGGKNKGLGVISSRGSCFRTGDAQYCTDGETDLLGNPRLTDGQVDIGCYQVGFDPGLMLLVK